MWILIGVLVLIGILWVAIGNRNGGNSPADWARDITEETVESIHNRFWGDDV
ncbi:MAG: hypothetical protein JWO67_4081 [Streptosporangiaceae bacterium]|nr:hypothetical protein [Streptosporangiaceae bacterium]